MCGADAVEVPCRSLSDDELLAIAERTAKGMVIFAPIPEEDGASWTLPLRVGSVVADKDMLWHDIVIEDNEGRSIATLESDEPGVMELALLMAGAVEDVPRLLATVDSMRAVVEAVREALRQLPGIYGHYSEAEIARACASSQLGTYRLVRDLLADALRTLDAARGTP